MKKLLFTALVATSLVACESKTATETKPVFNAEAAKKEIAAANLAFETAISKMDSVGISNLYATDAKWMNPNAPSVEGRAAIVGSVGTIMREGIGSAKLNTTEVWGDENFVTEEGVYLLNAKDGSQIDKGKYLVLWKRVDGKLMFYRDIFNSDLPPAK
jgi:ketosteroid isomerase-like protein